MKYVPMLLLLSLFCAASGYAQPNIPAAAAALREGYQCVSGDCQNGTGRAIVYHAGKIAEDFSGHFSGGLLDGAGSSTNDNWTYTGSFRAGKREGYGVNMGIMAAGDGYAADSNGTAYVAKWVADEIVAGARIDPYGDISWFSKGDWQERKNTGDAWITRHTAGYYTSRKGRFRKR